jgi:serine protease Do
MLKRYSIFALISVGCGMLGSFLFSRFDDRKVVFSVAGSEPAPISRVSYKSASLAELDFVKASRLSTPCVVFIKTESRRMQSYADDFWSRWDLFGQRGPVAGSGSGVIISADGYIVTNNHVIKDAEKIEVILNNNKHSYAAKVVGTDPSTDLALLKIDAKNLPKITMGFSDNVQIGEWVLAVGNPFNLTSTVTAGIVSAKGRNINVVNNQFPIESFIQTDAAINPGNSGGALVNLNGELVGINTAIASNTGSYNGYGFAIPVNIVAKIVKDLIEYGEVQRGFTGMDVKDIDASMTSKMPDDLFNGVYVEHVIEGGPADKAGIKAGDIITKVGSVIVESKSIIDEQIAYYRPGDELKLEIYRGGKTVTATLKLINREGNTSITKREYYSSEILGADLEPLSKMERDRYGITSGIKLSNIHAGRIRSMGLPDGFVIVSLNGKQYSSPEQLAKDLEKASGQITIKGIHPNGSFHTYSFFSR